MKAKKLILGLVALLILSFAASVSAGVPQMINYQGVLTDSVGCPVEDGTYTMIFRIYDAPTDGNLLWDETHDAVTVTQGNFNVLLGSTDSIPGSMFLSDSLWLAVKVGEDPEMAPRQRIASVGYAFRSELADTADYARTGPGVGDNNWAFRITDGADTTLMTRGEWGIARSGNTLYGNADSTHVNLGVECTTGTSGQNYKYCTVGGGIRNTASSVYATVAGGVQNTASGGYATVGGGVLNTACCGFSPTVGGGSYHTASGHYSTIGGGDSNTANDAHTTVAGGQLNTASGSSATVGGGTFNTASGNYATVGGGYHNTASGWAATVPGGISNTVAGDYCLAAGTQVKIDSLADYTFAFGNNFTTSTPHAVIFYDADSEMKVGIQTTSPTARLDVYGSTGYDQVRMRTSYTPTGTNDPNGNVGDIAWDDDYFYVKTSAGWKRVALSTW